MEKVDLHVDPSQIEPLEKQQPEKQTEQPAQQEIPL